MMALALPWLKSANLWLAAGILALCVVIFMAGERHERRKVEAETAELNTKLAGLKAKDRAELAAEAEKAKVTDAAVSGALTQQCILTEETAGLLASVR